MTIDIAFAEIVEPGTEIECPKTGKKFVVDDGNAVFRGSRAWMTQKAFDAYQAARAAEQQEPPMTDPGAEHYKAYYGHDDPRPSFHAAVMEREDRLRNTYAPPPPRITDNRRARTAQDQGFVAAAMIFTGAVGFLFGLAVGIVTGVALHGAPL